MMIISFGALHLKTIKKVIQLSAKTMIIVLCCIIVATRMDPLGGYLHPRCAKTHNCLGSTALGDEILD